MTTITSRRSILAGAAALPALAMPAIASVTVDPIFAAIGRHKITFLASMEASSVRSETINAEWSPLYDHDLYRRAEVTSRWANRAERRAALALTTIRPTTMAGVQALLEYVDAFTAGAFKLPSDPEGWYSGPIHWPSDQFDDGSGIDRFGLDVISNVCRSMQTISVQS